jgi:S1-C subfamily serine protease
MAAIHTRLLTSVLAGVWMLASVAPALAAEPQRKDEASAEDQEKKLEDARRRLDAAAREVADLSMSLSDGSMPRIMGFVGRGQRATLGIVIGGQRDADSDEGVEILSVSPGGAAQEAGLKAGDVLVEINGKALKKEGANSPRVKLLETMRSLNPGDKVTVKYRRDGKVSTASLVTQEPQDRLFAAPFTHELRGQFGSGVPGAVFMRAEGVFGTAELTPLTPKLGQYFGAEKGLLVVRAPADARLQLEDGDVILDIDGRVPSNAGHAFRILGSYQAGEKLKLNVLRMKKRMSFDVTIPDDPPERGIRRSRFMEYGPMEAAPAMPFNVPVPPPDGGAITIALPDDEPV